MANIFFQGAELRMSSGLAGSSIAPLDRIQSVNVSYQPPRASIGVLGRFSPLKDRPVINFTPVNLSFDFIKSSKTIESNLGILNSTGAGLNLANSESVNGFGLRNFEVAMASTRSDAYSNKVVLSSGALNSYSIQGSVGDPARGSCSFECLSINSASDTTTKTNQDYNGEVVKSEGTFLSGIEFEGFGLSGLMVQSFNLGVNLSRTSTFKLGSKYPERPITSIDTSLQVNGFMEGLNENLTLTGYDCGAPITGSYYLTLKPSCSEEPATTYKITNPHLEGQSFTSAVGSFVAVDLSFSASVSILESEATSGPNLTIT